MIDACVRLGCDYVDINGEVGWHKSMIDKYGEQAREKNVILVPSSGFDSIPSDLGDRVHMISLNIPPHDPRQTTCSVC